MFTLSFSLLSFYPLIHLSQCLERPAQLTCLNSHLSIPSIPMWMYKRDLVHWARSTVPGLHPLPSPHHLLVVSLPHHSLHSHVCVVSSLGLGGIEYIYFTIHAFPFFFLFHFLRTFNFPVSVIATSAHFWSFPSPLSSHLLIVTPQLSPRPLTPSLSHFPFNTCQLLPVRLSIEHHKKVTSLFCVSLLLVLVLLVGDGNFNS